MSTVVTCQCGARLRLPETIGNQPLLCPSCRAEIRADVPARVLSSAPAGAGSGAVCPICQSPIGPGEAPLTCPHCDQVHHQECWMEIGGCSTYGCKQAPAVDKEAPAARPLTAWGDTKKCPACGETIKSIALRCRYCKTEFDTVDPLSVADLRRGARKSENLKSLRNTIVVLFAITLLVGCAAPLMFIISLVVVLQKRPLIAKAGPVYLVLAYSTIALSLLYSILILIFLLVGIR